MGGMMLWVGRDGEGRRLERELRRLNAAADLRRAERDLSILQQGTTVRTTADLGPARPALNERLSPAPADDLAALPAVKATAGDRA